MSTLATGAHTEDPQGKAEASTIVLCHIHRRRSPYRGEKVQFSTTGRPHVTVRLCSPLDPVSSRAGTSSALRLITHAWALALPTLLKVALPRLSDDPLTQPQPLCLGRTTFATRKKPPASLCDRHLRRHSHSSGSAALPVGTRCRFLATTRLTTSCIHHTAYDDCRPLIASLSSGTTSNTTQTSAVAAAILAL